jgi:subtilisin
MCSINLAQSLPRPADCLTASAGRGQGILIGHLDSGIDPQHPAFKDAIQDYRFYDFKGIYDQTVTAYDATGHGTVMAGLLAGRATVNWEGGLAQESKLLVATVIESGHQIARILSGLIWMLEEPVRIVNLSIGITGWNPIFQPVIRALCQKGVLVVAAIGNGGAGQFCSPGAYPEVFTVGAADATGKALPFSGSKNEFTHCHKPDILSLSSVPSIRRGGDFYGEDTGTSGATAFVSGVAAQLMSLVPEATAEQVVYALKTTALPLSPEQKHRSQAGLIQPAAAAALLKTLPTVPHTNFEEVFERFRAESILFHTKYAPPEHFVPAILYVKSKDTLQKFIKKTTIQNDAISFLHLHEKYNFITVVAMKKQLEVWWENESVLMISPVC